MHVSANVNIRTSKFFVISFFNGTNLIWGFALFIFMMYVIKMDCLQLVRMASKHNIVFGLKSSFFL